jgi:hypothetical protein
MIWVMIAGVTGSLFAYLVVARPSIGRGPRPCVDTGVPLTVITAPSGEGERS